MNRRNTLIIAATSAVALATLTAGWMAHAQTTTNTLIGFDRPLVIDHKLERDIDALTKRIEVLETTVKTLQSQVAQAQASQTTPPPALKSTLK